MDSFKKAIGYSAEFRLRTLQGFCSVRNLSRKDVKRMLLMMKKKGSFFIIYILWLYKNQMKSVVDPFKLKDFKLVTDTTNFCKVLIFNLKMS
jgi:hypothetical protein